MGRLTSDNYATKELKRIFDNCFCLEVTTFLKGSKRSMADRKRCTLETIMLKENLKALFCRWSDKQWLAQNSAS